MEQENKMGTAPVGALLLKMSLPIILSTAVQSLYNIVDVTFILCYTVLYDFLSLVFALIRVRKH